MLSQIERGTKWVLLNRRLTDLALITSPSSDTVLPLFVCMTSPAGYINTLSLAQHDSDNDLRQTERGHKGNRSSLFEECRQVEYICMHTFPVHLFSLHSHLCCNCINALSSLYSSSIFKLEEREEAKKSQPHFTGNELNSFSLVGCFSDDSRSSPAGNRLRFIAAKPPFISTIELKQHINSWGEKLMLLL